MEKIINSIELIPNKLYYLSTNEKIKNTKSMICIKTDNTLK